MVHLEKICKSFPHPSGVVDVLMDLDLDLGEGKTLSILGPSGSGKSTLLSILSGLERADRGKVEMAGQNLSLLNEKDMGIFRSTGLGIVFQQFHLIPHLTALENVALPLEMSRRDSCRELAEEALNDVALGHRLNHFPSELSGGECQRVAIARAMVTSPKILLADEPSGNLDHGTGTQVMDTLFDRVHSAGTTMILVTHNQGLAQSCDTHSRMENGQLLHS